MKSEKVTDARRRYDDACAATHGMDIIGERWALPVMRELMLGPRRFSELRRALPALSANVLTQRLVGLEEAGIVRRQKLPPPVSAQVYGLTEWGQAAGPVFQALGRWAARSPLHDPTRPFSAVSLMLSLRTMIDVARVEAPFALAFRLGEEDFHFAVQGGAVTLGRGTIEAADLHFGGEVEGLTSLVAAGIYAGVAWDTLMAQGLAVSGDRALLEQLPSYFPLPAKANIGTQAG